MVTKNKKRGSRWESKVKSFLSSLGWFVNKTGVSTPGIDILAIKENIALLIETKSNFNPKKEKFNIKPYLEAYEELKDKTQLEPYILLFIKYNNNAVKYKIFYYDFENNKFELFLSATHLPFISELLTPENIKKNLEKAQEFNRKYEPKLSLDV